MDLTTIFQNAGLSFSTLVTVWDLPSGKMEKVTKLDDFMEISRTAFASIGDGSQPIFYNTEGKNFWRFDFSSMEVQELVLGEAKKGNQVAILDSGQALLVPDGLPGAQSIPKGTAYYLSPNGNFLAIQQQQGRIILWDVKNKKSSAKLKFQPFDATSGLVRYSKNGEALIISSKDGTWLLDTTNPVGFRQVSDYYDYSLIEAGGGDLQISPDGSLMGFVSGNGVSLQPFDNKLDGNSFNSYTQYSTAAFSDDGNLLAAGTKTGSVEIFVVDPRPLITSLEGAFTLISPADKSTVDSLHPDITILAPGLSEGGDIHPIFINEGEEITYDGEVTSPDWEDYTFHTDFNNLKPGTTYTWYLSYDSNQQDTIRSLEYSFTTPSNVQFPAGTGQISPSNGSLQTPTAEGLITLEWQSVPGAVSYVVCILSTNSEGMEGSNCHYGLTDTREEMPVSPGRHYRWYVIVKGTQAYSEKSDFWSFDTK
jgi:hypothetical protein